MCGIAGRFGQSSGSGADLDAGATTVLAHRGPDGFGRWDEDGVSLLHWRLAVIELGPAGQQPMLSSDGRLALSYNGEVYNFEALRADVEREWERRAGTVADGAPRARGWRGHSDTEVVLEGLSLWGPEFLSRLNGMFALAVFDRETRTLHLARDRAGIKPLYVWSGGDVLLFASEAKFFFHAGAFAPALDPRGLSAFFTYGHCHDDAHVLAGVRQLEPGEVLACTQPDPGASLVLRSSRLAPRPRWQPRRRTDDEAAAELRRILTDVVARQLVADVPVGVLLSGGVDSSILAALAAQTLGPDRTMAFTLGYPGKGPDYDELAPAHRVAAHLGVRHHVHEATQDDLVTAIEQLVWHFDEPFADAAALNVFVLSRSIRAKVTVALAGEGSDELFGGYRRYQLEKTIQELGALGRGVSRVVAALHLDRVGRLPRRAQILLRALARPDPAARYSSYLESEIPLEALLRPEWRRPVEVHPLIRSGYEGDDGAGTVSRLCLVDQQFWLPNAYLQKSDKGSMAHGLELRVPYLDDEVVAFANTLPDEQRLRAGHRKWLLRRAFGHLLPAEVFERFKRGFGVPVGQWLRGELRGYYADLVLSRASRLHAYLEMKTLDRCFRDHVAGVRDYSAALWQCLVLEVWLRHRERRFQRAHASPQAMRDAG